MRRGVCQGEPFLRWCTSLIRPAPDAPRLRRPAGPRRPGRRRSPALPAFPAAGGPDRAAGPIPAPPASAPDPAGPAPATPAAAAAPRPGTRWAWSSSATGPRPSGTPSAVRPGRGGRWPGGTSPGRRWAPPSPASPDAPGHKGPASRLPPGDLMKGLPQQVRDLPAGVNFDVPFPAPAEEGVHHQPPRQGQPDVPQQKDPAELQHPAHLRDHRRRVWVVVEGVTAVDHVKTAVRKGQMLTVPLDQVCPVPQAGPGLGQHPLRQVQPRHPAVRILGKYLRHQRPGAAAKIQYPVSPGMDDLLEQIGVQRPGMAALDGSVIGGGLLVKGCAGLLLLIWFHCRSSFIELSEQKFHCNVHSASESAFCNKNLLAAFRTFGIICPNSESPSPISNIFSYTASSVPILARPKLGSWAPNSMISGC